MKQINHWILALMLSILGSVSVWAQSGPTFSGAGTEANPYVLTTTEDMKWLMDNYRLSTQYNGLYLHDSYFVLGNDIDISSIGNWTPLDGPTINSQSASFCGTFDGRNHAIIGLTCTGNYCGFFYSLSTCLIQNLEMRNVNLQSTSSNTGAISCTGYRFNQSNVKLFTLRNIKVSGKISTKYSRIGGLVGSEAAGYFYDCTNEADITATEGFVGGLFGQQSNGSVVVSGCVNKGTITSQSGYAGGLAGCLKNGQVINCLNAGNIESNNYNNGGIIGSSGSTIDNPTVIVSSCLNLANVKGSSYVGHIVGGSDNKLYIYNCLWDKNATLTRSVYNVTSDYCGYVKSGEMVSDLCLGMTTSELSSGLAAFILQGSQTGTKWSQRIGTDALPQPGSNHQVYLASGRVHCDGSAETASYSNSPSALAIEEHHMENGFCQNCDKTEIPEQVDGWYEIASVGHLLWLRDEVNIRHKQNLKIRQIADIDLSCVCGPEKGSWEPIGNSSGMGEGTYYLYKSKYDGQNHKISNLYIHDEEANYFKGLFGNANESAISNLILENAVVEAPNCTNVGALVGNSGYTPATINNIQVTGTGHVVGSGNVGGIVGHIHSGTVVSNCSNYCPVTGVSGPGGIAGFVENGSWVTDCYNGSSATITATGNYAGGIVGSSNTINLARCTNLADVTAHEYAAGILGYAGNSGSSLADCYSAGTITSTNPAGIVARFYSNGITHCLFTGNVVQQGTADDFGLILGYCGTSYVSGHSDNYFSTSCKLIKQGVEQELLGSVFNSVRYETPLGEAVTPQDMENGPIAFKLQGTRKDFVWGQGLGVDKVPMINTLQHPTHQVYLLYGTVDCRLEPQTPWGFANSKGAEAVYLDHVFHTDGICTVCHGYQMPELQGNTYLIYNAGNMAAFRDFVNEAEVNRSANASLQADIDLSCICGPEKGNFMPIDYFKGSFYGNNHKITGFYFDNYLALNKRSNIGLFGYAGVSNETTHIQDLEVEGTIYTRAYDNSAILVAHAQGKLKVENCVTRGTVYGRHNAGGVIGYLGEEVTLSHCTNYAALKCSGTGVAGIVGNYIHYNNGSSNPVLMEGVSNFGNIEGSSLVAGIIGYRQAADYLTLKNVANYGDVKGERVGGLIGSSNNNTTIDGAFISANINGEYEAALTNLGRKASPDIYRVYYDNTSTLTLGGEQQDISLSADDGKAIAISHADVEKGKATFILGKGWGQELGKDKWPMVGGPRVWWGQYLGHAVEKPVYNTPRGSNTEHLMEEYEPHHIVGGVCTICSRINGEDVVYEPHHVYDADGWTSNNHAHNSMESHSWVITGAKDGDKLTFNAKTDTENGYDWLYYYITKPGETSRVMLDRLSGSTDKLVEIDLTVDGTYILEVEYSKDTSNSVGKDEVSVFNVTGPSLVNNGIKGDINGDTVFDKKDVDALRDIIKRYTVPEDIKGDFNGDGRTTISDLNIMLKVLNAK